MAEKQGAAPVREAVGDAGPRREASGRPVVRARVESCDDCCATMAFHAWRDQHMTPSFNWFIDFGGSGIPPAGKRAVIELVTATVTVPQGEMARLRMLTSLGSMPSNFDLFLTPQGVVAGNQLLVATHAIRAYSDSLIEFSVNRDNAQTEGDALVCISGYIVG